MQKRSKPPGEDRDRQDSLKDLIRTGPQQLIAQALQAEMADLLATYVDRRDKQGHARVLLSDHQLTRPIQTGMGPVTVQLPKVHSCQGALVTFHTALVPRMCARPRASKRRYLGYT